MKTTPRVIPLPPGATLFFAPMVPQPSDGTIGFVLHGDEWLEQHIRDDDKVTFGDLDKRHTAPFAPGDVLAVGERGVRYQIIGHRKRPDGAAFDEIGDGQFAYESDGWGTVADFIATNKAILGVLIGEIETEFYDWRPADTMPAWAARKHVTVTEVTPVELSKVSGDDLAAAGFPPDDSPVMRDGARLTLHGRRLCFLEYYETTHPDHADDKHAWRVAVETKGD